MRNRQCKGSAGENQFLSGKLELVWSCGPQTPWPWDPPKQNLTLSATQVSVALRVMGQQCAPN